MKNQRQTKLRDKIEEIYANWHKQGPRSEAELFSKLEALIAKEKKALLEEITSGAGTADEAGHRAASILIKLKEMEGSD